MLPTQSTAFPTPARLPQSAPASAPDAHARRSPGAARCPTHGLPWRVYEAPIEHIIRLPRRGATRAPALSADWSASYVWAYTAAGVPRFVLRAGPTRSFGSSFALRRALDERNQPKALLTSRSSLCEHDECDESSLSSSIALEAALACGSPVRPHFVGLNDGGHKVWITTLFDADLHHVPRTLACDSDRLLLAYRTAEVGLQACARMHSHRIGHGDIKPENFFWDGRGQLVLGDFDLAFTTDPARLEYQPDWRGTPAFVAPEIHQRDYSDEALKSDVFSLGMSILMLFSPQAFEGLEARHAGRSTLMRAGWQMQDVDDRHAMLGQFAALLRGEGGDPADREPRYGERWNALSELLRRLWLQDEPFARLVVFGMLPLAAPDRGAAATLLLQLQALIGSSEPLMQASWRFCSKQKQASAEPLQAEARHTAFGSACQAMFAELSETSRSARRARQDLSLLGRHASHRLSVVLGTHVPQVWHWLSMATDSLSQQRSPKPSSPWARAPRCTSVAERGPAAQEPSVGWWQWMRGSVRAPWGLPTGLWPWWSSQEPLRLKGR